MSENKSDRSVHANGKESTPRRNIGIWIVVGILAAAILVYTLFFTRGAPASPSISTTAESTPSATAIVLTATETPSPTATPTPAPTATPVGGGSGTMLLLLGLKHGNDYEYEYSLVDTQGNVLGETSSMWCDAKWGEMFYSQASGKIIYYCDDGIYTIKPDGSEQRQILSASLEYALLSPDGTQIVYVDKKGMWLIDADGSSRRLLVQVPDKKFISPRSWSPDGNWIIYQMYDSNLYIIRVDGTGKRVLNRSSMIETSWTPDNSRFYFSQRNTDTLVYYTDIETGARVKLNQTGIYNDSIFVSPSGDQVAYLSGVNVGQPTVYEKQAGESERNVSYTATSYSAFNHQIIVADLEGNNPQSIVDAGGQKSLAGWSPDGEWIYFYTDIYSGSPNATMFRLHPDGADVQQMFVIDHEKYNADEVIILQVIFLP